MSRPRQLSIDSDEHDLLQPTPDLRGQAYDDEMYDGHFAMANARYEDPATDPKWSFVDKAGSVQNPKRVEDAIDERLTAIVKDPKAPSTLEAASAQKDHEKVIEISSRIIESLSKAPVVGDLDGVRKLCVTLKSRFEAYKALGLLSLAVADAERTFALLSNYPVPKSSDGETTPMPILALGDDLPSMKRPSPEENESTGSGRPRKEARTDEKHQGSILHLSTELILQIADRLQPADRIAFANTHRGLRKIKGLWQHLIFVRTQKVAHYGWHYDTVQACADAIETCQRRSHSTLVSVTLKGLLASGHLDRIFEALRPSFKTLTHLAIPTYDQSRCFREVYRHCPLFNSVNIRTEHEPRNPEGGVPHGFRTTSMFPPFGVPFELKYFFSRPDLDCGDIYPYMKSLEIVHGIPLSQQRGPNIAKTIVSLAPGIREWIDRPVQGWTGNDIDRYGTKAYKSDRPTVFPRLRKLNAAWIEWMTGCEFPVLEELYLDLHNTETLCARQEHPVEVLTKSPMLKSLDVLLPFSSRTKSVQVLRAVAQLQHLEKLQIWSRELDFTLRTLIEAQKDEHLPLASSGVMWPNLRTFGILVKHGSLDISPSLEEEVCELLLFRLLRKKGCSLAEARKRTEAALVAYDKPSHKRTQKPKKKLLSDAALLAADSVYKGEYEKVDDMRREVFSPELECLVINKVKDGWPPKGKQLLVPNALLSQLVVRHFKKDISETFESDF